MQIFTDKPIMTNSYFYLAMYLFLNHLLGALDFLPFSQHDAHPGSETFVDNISHFTQQVSHSLC